MKTSFFCLAVLALVIAVTPAWARRSGDMFEDNGVSTYGRPWVPSDEQRGPDVFPPVPTLLNENADVVKGIEKHPTIYPEEMVYPRYAPQPYAKMFQTPE
jgi:hypothetical protein